MPDRPHVVRAQGLTKFYGHARGVVDLDFSVDGGEVFGFLGPNGARTDSERVQGSGLP